MDESTRLVRYSDSMRHAFLSVLLSTLVLFILAPAVADAQVPVVTDITSSGLGTEVPLELPTDGVYNITGGTRPGGGPNLFHSFGNFSVGPGDIANFLNDSGLATSNILGRVTGGNISNIYGTIRTTGFDVDGLPANLFLVNPNGVIFGPEGSFDVTGSVSFSTAQYLRLFDGVNSAIFYADSANDGLDNSVLAVAPVVDFGFLSPAAYGFLTAPDPSATITVQGSFLQVPITLDPVTGQPKGNTLSLVGGNINIVADPATGTPATLMAPSGQINLMSVTSPGEIVFPGLATGPNINGVSFTTMGTVTIKESTMLDVSGQLEFDADGNPIGGNSGTVFVRGGQLVMEASSVLAFTLGAADGAGKAVDIQVSQDVALTTGSSIVTLAFGSGRGGDVLLTADTVTLEGNSTILTGAFNDSGDGIGGDVVLFVREVSLMGGSSIQSQSQSFTSGLGHGNVTIQGLPGAESGAAESVTLSGGSNIVSTTFSFGDGGQVAITAQSLKMEGPDTTIITSTNADGRGGDMVVRVLHASFLEGATLKTLTGSADPNAPAAATVTVQGLNGRMAESVALSGSGSGIVSETTGAARSGHVTVESNAISLTDGAVIQTGTLSNVGAGGDVTINAGSFDMSGGSRITSLSAAEDAGQVAINADTSILSNVSIETFTSSSGQAGNVVLNVGTMSLSNGATINSASSAAEAVPNPDGSGTTTAPGAAGNITITAAGSFTSDASTVATTAEANHGGDISITAQNVQLSNGTLITANSKAPLVVTELVLDQDGLLVSQVVGDGNAGNVTITSASNVIMQNSSVTTEASQASGGQITIKAADSGMVQLINSKVITSVAGSDGDTSGGDISIDPQFVILQNSQILAQAFAGTGGNINMVSNVFLADPASIIDASSQLGISGTVNIQAPVQNVSGELVVLSQDFSSAAALLAQQCAARVADGKFSTFVVAAREGLPIEPGGFLSSPSFVTELGGSILSGRPLQARWLVAEGSLQEHDAKPLQLAKLGNVCRR